MKHLKEVLCASIPTVNQTIIWKFITEWHSTIGSPVISDYWYDMDLITIKKPTEFCTGYPINFVFSVTYLNRVIYFCTDKQQFQVHKQQHVWKEPYSQRGSSQHALD